MTSRDTLKNIISELPEIYHSIIIKYFEIIWTAGFDEGRKQLSHRKPIIQIYNGKIINIWLSEIDAANNFGINKAAISKAVNGKSKTCMGFKWEYLHKTK